MKKMLIRGWIKCPDSEECYDPNPMECRDCISEALKKANLEVIPFPGTDYCEIEIIEEDYE